MPRKRGIVLPVTPFSHGLIQKVCDFWNHALESAKLVVHANAHLIEA
jgi:hypothetical protein